MTAPQPVFTAAQMRAAEERLIERGASVGELMQRAGEGAAEWVWRIAAGRSVTVLCGLGNNGGDGYVIAETLRQRGLEVSVVAPLPPATAAAQEARARFGDEVTEEASGAVFVDCLFGTGLKRPLSDELAGMFRKLRESHDYAVAVDLPSVVEADTGKLLTGNLPRFDLTLALGAWTRAHWLMPAMALMGERRLVETGVEANEASAQLSQRPRLRPPAPDAHKYRRGLVAVIGGTMPGAAILSCEAAMQAGAGYVKLLAEHSHPAAPADLVVEQGSLAEALTDKRIDAVLVGPGLGRSEASRHCLEEALAAELPLVLDADALMLLGPSNLAGRTAPTILTPHAGELEALCQAFGSDEQSKVAQATALAQASSAVVLAKGPGNLLTDGKRLRFFRPASSWLSTAGTGDVLAGIVASRLAHSGNAFQAAEEAVWLHSEAARLVGAAFTAGDLARYVSDAYAALL